MPRPPGQRLSIQIKMERPTMSMMREIGLADTAPASRPTYDARAMTGTDGLAQIVLDDKVYTLRITKAGKLILTK